MKHQVICIGGGNVFTNKKQLYSYLRAREYNPYKQSTNTWKAWLKEKLAKTHDVIIPEMPNRHLADYTAWKIWFEKLVPYIHKQKNKKLILIGNSLGGIFLAKYLSENTMPKHIDQLHLVAPVFDNSGTKRESLVSFTLNTKKLKHITPQAEHSYIHHSTDDPIVPFNHAKKYLKHLPTATLTTYNNRGHFLVPTFPELLRIIQKN